MIIKGVTDSITTCDACGKCNLKKTVELETEAGEIVHYGSDCAAFALTGKKSSKGADAVARLAGAVSFVKRNMGSMKVGAMHDRLSACAWANVSHTKKGAALMIWNDAGKVEIALAT